MKRFIELRRQVVKEQRKRLDSLSAHKEIFDNSKFDLKLFSRPWIN